ncbi:hypothetical protein V6L77_01065 [Pannonibacter sp. Pt2-lr]
MLKPGEQVEFGDKGVSVPRPVDLDETLAWRNGRFVFYRASLGSVLQEIGRYRKGRILVTSDALARELVSGSFAGRHGRRPRRPAILRRLPHHLEWRDG